MKRLTIQRIVQVIAALLAAPIAATAVYMVATTIRFGTTDPNDAMSFAAIVLFVASSISLLIGLPAHLLFRFLGWNQLWRYVVGGACIGLLGEYVMHFTQIDGAVSGAIGAATFWLIAARTSAPAASS